MEWVYNDSEQGYWWVWFTLADASPVSVTSTTENGLAARVGVIAGDKIIKVSGAIIICHARSKVNGYWRYVNEIKCKL